MNLQVIKSEGLAHNSYYLSSGEEAVVIDPRRDCEVYLQQAKKDCAEIKYILETHRNEDYVVGSLELQNLIDAEIGHSKELPFKYGDHNLEDGDTLNVGEIEIEAIYTPGHTNESLCYLISRNATSEIIFTGDTLFAGSVGRTDLHGKQMQPIQSEKLYNSFHEKILQLDNGVLIYPAHGAGSVCGKGITGQEPTTVGYEKKKNPYLQLSKEEFIDKSSNESLVVPRYFKQMEIWNLNGPPLLSNLSNPKPMSLSTFEKEMQPQGMIVIDTRMPYSFAGSHIPNSLSVWLDGTSVYPGWILDTDQYILFVHERPEDIDIVTSRFHRLGFDNICGYLCHGMNDWQEAGKPIRNFTTMDVTDLKNKLDGGEVQLIDVRQSHEWLEDGYVDGAKLIQFVHLSEKFPSLAKDKAVAVTCSVGNRASIALSMLERAGFENLSNVLGGMIAWTNLGYPVKTEV